MLLTHGDTIPGKFLIRGDSLELLKITVNRRNIPGMMNVQPGGKELVRLWHKGRKKAKEVRLEEGMGLIEVVVLLFVVGLFVVAAAPLFSRFLQVRASVDYTLQATVLAQDIMERIRGKTFADLEDRIGEWELSDSSDSDFKTFLYGSSSFPLTIPPRAQEESRVVIRREGSNSNSDMLVVEIEIKWRELLKTSQETQKRTYRVATYVYRYGIRELRGGGG